MFELLPGIEVLKAFGFYYLVTTARPLGFILLFTVFSFAIHRAQILKIAMAFVFGLPVLVANQGALFDIYIDDAFADRIFIPLKELVLGALIGFFASLPFYGFLFAGKLIDNYRGESSNQIKLEGGSTTTTLGLVFYLVLLFAFLKNDGLWHLISVVYYSFTIWPVAEAAPRLEMASMNVIFTSIIEVFFVMIKVGAPMLILIFLCEFFISFASIFGQRFGFGSSAALSKNLCVLLILPAYFVALSYVVDGYVAEVWSSIDIIRGF